LARFMPCLGAPKIGERAEMPAQIYAAQAQKPAESYIVVALLQQHPLGAHPVERLEQPGVQQLLRLYRWEAF